MHTMVHEYGQTDIVHVYPQTDRETDTHIKKGK